MIRKAREMGPMTPKGRILLQNPVLFALAQPSVSRILLGLSPPHQKLTMFMYDDNNDFYISPSKVLDEGGSRTDALIFGR